MPPPPSLVEAYHHRLLILRSSLSAGLVRLWDELDLHGEDEASSFTAEATPLLSGTKAATVATSAAFFALALSIRPAAVSAADVPIDARITDPFLATWHALKVGRPPAEAIAAGRSQAEATGYDFVQSTARRTGDHVARASGRSVRWQRIPGGNACAWCQLVAGQLYHSSESADFGHDRCDCIAVPA